MHRRRNPPSSSRLECLLQTALIVSTELKLTGDANATTEIELIPVPTEVTGILFNGEHLKTSKFSDRNLIATVNFNTPSIPAPDFSTIKWKYIDSLPEIQPYTAILSRHP
jgi:beta-galactosidase